MNIPKEIKLKCDDIYATSAQCLETFKTDE